MSREVVYLFDFHYLVFRAYHALPDLKSRDGAPVGAIRGYTQSLLRFLRKSKVEYAAAASDFALTCFRNDLYPDYKRGRTEAPPDLEPQFEPCKEITRALGIPLFEAEDFEADDVIATLVRRLERGQPTIWIVTRDKDLSALVTSDVRMMEPRGGDPIGPAEVEAKYGVPPELFPDYLSLVGDATDNIPGVRGIGPSTARGILRHFGGLDSIPLDDGSWKGVRIRYPERARDLLRDGQEELALSRSLVRLRDDLDIDVEVDDLRCDGARRDLLVPLFERYGLGRLVPRVPRWSD
jgi:DNA polymerase-1